MLKNKVSIVVPTYKRPDYLARLLKSIEAQTYQEFEIIVIDDNSPNYEAYLPLIMKFSQIFKEFRFLRNDINKGAPYSRNKGILECKYDLVALVDDDDEWLPEKLERQVEIFKNTEENVGLVFTWADAKDESGQVIHQYRSELEGSLKKEILNECFIPSPSVMVRKKAIVRAGLFDESFPSCQDWDIWTRIVFSGYELRCVKKVLAIYNKHPKGSIGDKASAIKGYKVYLLRHLVKYIKSSMFVILLKRFYYYFIKTSLS